MGLLQRRAPPVADFDAQTARGQENSPAGPLGPQPALGGMLSPEQIAQAAADQYIGYRYGRTNDSLVSRRIVEEETYDEINDEIYRATGRRLPNPVRDEFWDPAGQGALAERFGGDVSARWRRWHEEVAAMAASNPAVAAYSREDMLARAQQRQAGARRAYHDRLGEGDALDQIVRGLQMAPGMIVGALSTGSPEQIAQLGAGGGGRGVAAVAGSFAERVTVRTGIGAASNIAAQAAIEPAIIEDARRMGEEHTMEMVTLDFILAGVLGGALSNAGAPGAPPGLDAPIVRTRSRLRDSVTLPPVADDVTPLDSPGSGQAVQDAVAGRAESLVVAAAQRDRATRANMPDPMRTNADALVDEIIANERYLAGETDSPVLSEPGRVAAPEEIAAAARAADEAPAPPVGSRERVTINGRTRPRVFERFDAAALSFDPAAFQFRRADGPQGSTGTLADVEAWDGQSAGKIVVFEAADGRLYVADGHQRVTLAQALAARDGAAIELDGYRYREADGWTAEEVRNLAAQKNMREGAVDPLDVAQLLRDAPDLLDSSVPQRGADFRMGRSLARLSDEAFAAVRGGVIEPRLGAVIGEVAAGRPEVHAPLVDLFRRNPPANGRDAAYIAREAMSAAVARMEEAQISLFGDPLVLSGMQERAEILRAAGNLLRDDKRVFAVAERNADALEAAGNVLAAEENARRADLAGALLREIDVLATRPGPVANALRAVAERAAAEKLPAAEAARQFVDEVAQLLETRGLQGLKTDPPARPPAPATIEPPNMEAEARSATLRGAHDKDAEAINQAMAEAALERAMRGETGDVIPEDALGVQREADLMRIEDAAEALGLEPDPTEMDVAAAILARGGNDLEADARARLQAAEIEGEDTRPATFADAVEDNATIEPPFRVRDFDDPAKLADAIWQATLPELESVARAEGVEGLSTRAQYLKAFGEMARPPEPQAPIPPPLPTNEVRDLERRALRFVGRDDATQRYADAKADLADAILRMRDGKAWLARRIEDEADARRLSLWRKLQGELYPEGRFAKDILGDRARGEELSDYAPERAGEALEAFNEELAIFRKEYEDLQRLDNAIPAAVREPIDAIFAVTKDIEERPPGAMASQIESRDRLKTFRDEHADRMGAIRSDDDAGGARTLLDWVDDLLSAYNESIGNKRSLAQALADGDADAGAFTNLEAAVGEYAEAADGTPDAAFAEALWDLIGGLRSEGIGADEALAELQPLLARIRRNLDELWDEWQPTLGARADEATMAHRAEATPVERALYRTDLQLRDLVAAFEGAGMDHGGLRVFSRPRGVRFAQGWTAIDGGTTPAASVASLTSAVRAAFPRVANQLLERGRLTIVQSLKDVPLGADLIAAERFGVLGYAKDGRSWIVADNVAPEFARKIVMHEVGVHIGQKEMLGEAGHARLLAEVERLRQADPDLMRGWNMASERGVPGNQMIEETLAYAIQEADPENMSAGLRGLINRLVNSVRAWLWRTFPNLRAMDRLSFEDMQWLALGGLRHAARNETREIVVGRVAEAPDRGSVGARQLADKVEGAYRQRVERRDIPIEEYRDLPLDGEMDAAPPPMDRDWRQWGLSPEAAKIEELTDRVEARVAELEAQGLSFDTAAEKAVGEIVGRRPARPNDGPRSPAESMIRDADNIDRIVQDLKDCK